MFGTAFVRADRQHPWLLTTFTPLPLSLLGLSPTEYPLLPRTSDTMAKLGVTMRLTVALLFQALLAFPQDQLPNGESIVYLNPTPVAATLVPVSSSSYDFWWPFPPSQPSMTSSILSQDATSAASVQTPLNPSMSSSVVVSSYPASIAFFPTGTYSLNMTSLIASSTDSSTSNTTVLSSTNVFQPYSSDTLIRITASSSPQSAVYTSSHPFKLVYLTPLFALLGIVSGATITGMIYGRYCGNRRKVNVDDDPTFIPAQLQAPRTRTVRIEEGFTYLGKTPHFESDDEEEDGEPNEDTRGLIGGIGRSPYPGTPYRAYATPLQRLTPGTAFSPASDYSHTPLRAAPNDAAASVPATRSWYDPLPGLISQVYSSTMKTPLSNQPMHRIPATEPVEFEDVTFSPVPSNQEDGVFTHDVNVEGGRTHSSIRRTIAERLRLGSRHGAVVGGKKEGLKSFHKPAFLLDEVQVRKASGSEIRKVSSGVQHRSSGLRQEARIHDDLIAGTREEHVARTPVGVRLTPSHPEIEPFWHYNAEDSDSHELPPPPLPKSPLFQRRGSGTPLLPKADLSQLVNQRASTSKLRAKSRIVSSTSSNTPILPDAEARKSGSRKFRPRVSSSSQQAFPVRYAEAPMVVSNPDESDETALRLLSPPLRVLSPPADPELFFADPVLGAYVTNPDPRSQASSSSSSTAHVEPKPIRGKLHRVAGAKRVYQRQLALSDDDELPDTGVSTTSSTAPIPLQAVSAFSRPLQHDRQVEAVGAVDAIVKSGWNTRAGHSEFDYSETYGDIRGVIPVPPVSIRRVTPSMMAAKRNSIHERVKELKARQAMDSDS